MFSVHNIEIKCIKKNIIAAIANLFSRIFPILILILPNIRKLIRINPNIKLPIATDIGNAKAKQSNR